MTGHGCHVRLRAALHAMTGVKGYGLNPIREIDCSVRRREEHRLHLSLWLTDRADGLLSTGDRGNPLRTGCSPRDDGRACGSGYAFTASSLDTERGGQSRPLGAPIETSLGARRPDRRTADVSGPRHCGFRPGTALLCPCRYLCTSGGESLSLPILHVGS